MHTTDSRLLEAYALIDSGDFTLLSVDIFDTLVWRKLPNPKDLFLILGRRLKQEGWLIPACTAEGFADLRVSAEKAARDEKEFALNNTEVTLPEIYWQLQPIFVSLSLQEMLEQKTKGIYESDVSPLVELELSLEKEFLQFDGNILHLILYAHQKKMAVVLVSDTYLEEKQLLYLLQHPKLPKFYELVPSCVYGCSKKEGLFQEMVHALDHLPFKILHIGDNEKTDILPAQSVGIKTLHYCKYAPKFEAVLEREWGENFEKRGEFLDPTQGDFGLTALRAKIEHHTDLLTLKEEDLFYWKYGATILGPPLLGFIHWIYRRCEQMQEKRVFCLMREGKLYARLIERFAPFFPQHSLEAKHLWVSRLFITHAALATAHQKELMATMNAFLEHFTIDNFCSYLGLDIAQMPKWIRYRHVMLEDKSLRNKFILTLIRNPTLRSQIIKTAAAKRERFLNYLAGLTPLSSPSQMTLVDVGWNGSAQEAMQHILRLAGSPLKLHGLYLGTTQAANSGLLRGIVREGYLFKGGEPPCNNAHKKGCFVLEQTATAETGVGSLHDIDEEGKIVTSPLKIPAKQKKQAEMVQKGIFALFDLAGSYIQSGALQLDADSRELQNQLREILLRSMINTTQEEAIKFGAWFHEHGPAFNLIQLIGKNAYYENFIHDMLPVAAFKESGLNWPAAYAAKNSKYLTLMSQAMWLKTLPPECFLSKDAFSFRVFVDTGRNFSKKAQKQVELRSNPNRSFYTLVKLYSSKKAMKRVQLMLTFPSALVRIKSLRLIAFDKTTPEPHELAFFESQAEKQALKCISGKQMDFNTFLCTDHLQFIHAFEQKGIYQLQIKLCCEMFRTPVLKAIDTR